jgi:hypothetical protein
MRRIITPLAALGALALLVTPALAGRSTSSVSLVVVSPLSATSTTSSNAVPFGSQVTYDVATTATSYPWVETLCYQGRTLVYGQTRGFFDGYFTDPMYTLGPTQVWSGGAATCTATLFSYDSARRKNLATTSFNVA